ncbi:Uma2 family endonuclease [Synechococcus sp. PCC 7336]|uniref:Uma2 family endonuclease n=1 Tax=Synechococcus sp. PCC 7336 TaxID=195250 RepID=UPI0003473441|nr:Uma2 family endonuclease [Synechococcus sp. PCC 7336]
MVATLPISIPRDFNVNDEQFLQFARANPELRIERAADGTLIVMAPTGSEGGNLNFELGLDLGLWNRQTQLGKVFDSSTGFRLPNGAIRAPDLAWIAGDRWQSLTSEQRRGFAPICPDFVMQLASESDDIAMLRLKMQEYIDNGCRLGWLISPKTECVEVYRPRQSVESLSFPTSLSGEDILPNFVLDLQAIFKSVE